MTASAVTVPASWGEPFLGLGLTCDIATAAKLLGIGRTTAFDLLRRGTFPVEVIPLGRVRRVRTSDLFAYLRVSTSGTPAPGHVLGPPPSTGDPDPESPRAA